MQVFVSGKVAAGISGGQLGFASMKSLLNKHTCPVLCRTAMGGVALRKGGAACCQSFFFFFCRKGKEEIKKLFIGVVVPPAGSGS